MNMTKSPSARPQDGLLVTTLLVTGAVNFHTDVSLSCDHYGGNNTQRSAGEAIDICNRSKELITLENFLIFLLPSRFIINDEWRKRESGLYS